MKYYHRVEIDDRRRHKTHEVLYAGNDPADAMAAWSKAIADGVEYVTLESLDQPGLD